jgi:alpha-beta hydrolase superfamily lysophospholipase
MRSILPAFQLPNIPAAVAHPPSARTTVMSPIPPPSSFPPTEDGHFLSQDGLRLAWFRWDPPAAPRGTVCLAHGHGEHAGRYHHVAQAFVRSGFVFLAFDWRGHGKSEGPLGHSPSLGHMLDDVGRFLALESARPRLAYGHSMGGLLVLLRALTDPAGIHGVIATSPWLRLSFPAPAFKVLVGRMLQGTFPSMTTATGLEQAALSHDAAVVAAYAADPLVHERLSFRLGIDLLNGGEWALGHAAEFRLPILLMHGEADRITDPQATAEFFDHAGSADKTLRLWPGHYHETHNELEWQNVVEVSTGWARAHAV